MRDPPAGPPVSRKVSCKNSLFSLPYALECAIENVIRAIIGKEENLSSVFGGGGVEVTADMITKKELTLVIGPLFCGPELLTIVHLLQQQTCPH
jgi:hypothetical protein